MTGEYAGIAADFNKVLEMWFGREEVDLEIRTEYGRLFLIPNGVKPYESVYRGKEQLLMQEPWQQVKEFYRRNGLVLEDPAPHPEDHVSVEMAFMAYLIENSTDLSEQKLFFETHISQWLPAFLGDLKEHRDSSFFSEMAAICLDFLEVEASHFLSIPGVVEEESEQRSDSQS